MTENSFVKENLQAVRERMENACIAAGRPVDAVQLLAVTKTVEPAYINEAIASGVTQIGENRVQEYLGKRDALHLSGVKTHLIGHLQTNKVKSIVGAVDMIQSVDSLHLAQAIDKASTACGVRTDVLVEVNIGREPQKSGVLPEKLPALLEEIASLSGISVCGMMTVPPILEKEYEKSEAQGDNYYQRIIDRRIDAIPSSEISSNLECKQNPGY